MHTHTHTHTHAYVGTHTHAPIIYTHICWNIYTHLHAYPHLVACHLTPQTSERQNSGDTRMKQNASGQANPTKLCASLSIRKLAQLQRACALYDFNQKPLLSDMHNVGTALLGREMFGPNHLYTLGKLFVFVL